MSISNYDLACLAVLQAIRAGSEPGDGCNIHALAADGLVIPTPSGWQLTNAGQLRLINLQSLARIEVRDG